MHTTQKKLQAFERLLTIVDNLRTQCPWDKKQTIASLRHLTIEEVYELSEAILQNNMSELKKELGDLALHLVLYARIASETQEFDIADVLNFICDKLIHRHPHIYGKVKAHSEEEVKENWEKIKLKEGNKSVLAGIPASVPALIKAYRMQEKAHGVGFDWEHAHEVWNKVQEELNEFQQCVDIQQGKATNLAKAEQEFGDLLFALVNYARFIGINPEDALEKTNQKFLRRFQFIEQAAKENNQAITDLTLEEMNFFWERAKKAEDLV
ncbi:MAG: nucleoside triphosphate pyrophosphohydrolase [Microscillaceae bacterium]|nr:nucleoside triphosphate pyrophosphohydrolase [Microscillaceae bacterium]MDW8460537.1 nucleoside triphosphate pyrophosphohydrolase [Cytophagales bacterium]